MTFYDVIGRWNTIAKLLLIDLNNRKNFYQGKQSGYFSSIWFRTWLMWLCVQQKDLKRLSAVSVRCHMYNYFLNSAAVWNKNAPYAQSQSPYFQPYVNKPQINLMQVLKKVNLKENLSPKKTLSSCGYISRSLYIYKYIYSQRINKR